MKVNPNYFAVNNNTPAKQVNTHKPIERQESKKETGNIQEQFKQNLSNNKIDMVVPKKEKPQAEAKKSPKNPVPQGKTGNRFSYYS